MGLAVKTALGKQIAKSIESISESKLQSIMTKKQALFITAFLVFTTGYRIESLICDHLESLL